MSHEQMWSHLGGLETGVFHFCTGFQRPCCLQRGISAIFGHELRKEPIVLCTVGTLMVSTDQEEPVWQGQLPCQQQQQGLHSPSPPVHKVAIEDVDQILPRMTQQLEPEAKRIPGLPL